MGILPVLVIFARGLITTNSDRIQKANFGSDRYFLLKY